MSRAQPKHPLRITVWNRNFSSGLYEVRSNLTGRRIARVFFTVSGRNMVLLHGFIKKTQATPAKELKLAERRMKEYNRYG